MKTLELLQHITRKPITETRADLMYADSTVAVAEPRSIDTMKYYGQKTPWDSVKFEFEEYLNDGTLYVILIKGGKRYQLFIPDNGIDYELIDDSNNDVHMDMLLDKYPSIGEALGADLIGNILRAENLVAYNKQDSEEQEQLRAGNLQQLNTIKTLPQ